MDKDLSVSWQVLKFCNEIHTVDGLVLKGVAEICEVLLSSIG